VGADVGVGRVENNLRHSSNGAGATRPLSGSSPVGEWAWPHWVIEIFVGADVGIGRRGLGNTRRGVKVVPGVGDGVKTCLQMQV
jgi:hypothetical protein